MVSSASRDHSSEDDKDLGDPSEEVVEEEEDNGDLEEEEEEEDEEEGEEEEPEEAEELEEAKEIEEVEEIEEFEEDEVEEVEEEEEYEVDEEEVVQEESEVKEVGAVEAADALDSTFDSDHNRKEKSIPMPPPSALGVNGSSCSFKFAAPSSEMMIIETDYLHSNQEDCNSPKVTPDVLKAKVNISAELLVRKQEDEPILLANQDKSYWDCKSHSYHSNIIEKFNESGRTKKKGASVITQEGCTVEQSNGIQHVVDRNNQICNDSNEMRSRLTVPDTRTRNLSPNNEATEGNKRPAVICEFFAKGWCIRGTSCRFLHIRDHPDQDNDGDLANTNQKKEIHIEEGLKGPSGSKAPGFPFPNTSSGSTSTFSSNTGRILSSEQGRNPTLHEFHQKYKFSSLKKEDLFVQKHAAPGVSSALRETFPCADKDIANASHNDYGKKPSSPFTCREGLVSSCDQHIYKGFTSLVTTPSINLSSTDNHPSRSIPSSRYILNKSGHSYSSGSSFDKSHHSTQMLNCQREYRASRLSLLLPCSLSGSEPRLSSVNSSWDLSGSANYKFKISANDWEPSVPFQPSFFITPMSVSSPGKQYDPFLDSIAIEIPNIGDGSLKISFCNPESSMQNPSHKRIYGDSAAIRNHDADLNDEKSSVSSHNRLYDNVRDKVCLSRDKDFVANETEVTIGTSGHCQNDAMTTGENQLGPDDCKKADNYEILQSYKPRKTNDLELHRERKTIEVDSEWKMDEGMQKESKALKYFRAALLDLVKELLKPTWREGQISKDAHNIVVKRSVDKVLSTLQSQKIPTTADTVKQYLSASRPKIAKLVEGYIAKYGKS